MAEKKQGSDTDTVTEELDILAPSEPDTSVASTSRWAEPARRLRSTTRWLLAIFGVIGTAFLGSLPFVGLGELDWPSVRAVFALAGALLLVGGLTLVLRAASEVFVARVGTLTDFTRDWESSGPEDGATSAVQHGSTVVSPPREPSFWERLGIRLEHPPYPARLGLRYPQFEVYQGVSDTTENLARAWHDARMAKWRTASVAAMTTTTDGPEQRLEKLAAARFKELDDASAYLVSLAAYRELVHVYRWAQNWIFGGAAMVALGAFIFFAAVQNPDEDDGADGGGTPQTQASALVAAISAEDPTPAEPDPTPGPPCPEGCSAPPPGPEEPEPPTDGEEAGSDGAVAAGLGAALLATLAGLTVLWAHLRQVSALRHEPLLDQVLRVNPKRAP